jgi:electron transport complex protein RnfG
MKNSIELTTVAKTVISGAIFTIICIALVVIIGNTSKEKIKDNQKQQLINQLSQLVSDFDNDILQDSNTQTLQIYNNSQTITTYQAKKHGKIIATLIKHTYPKGYSGDIVILTAIDVRNNIIGARILEHSETPGLGDKIEIKKSNWMMSFNNTNLANKVWEVKKNGGDFDSFTGATITPRAVVLAIKELLAALQKSPL